MLAVARRDRHRQRALQAPERRDLELQGNAHREARLPSAPVVEHGLDVAVAVCGVDHAAHDIAEGTAGQIDPHDAARALQAHDDLEVLLPLVDHELDQVEVQLGRRSSRADPIAAFPVAVPVLLRVMVGNPIALAERIEPGVSHGVVPEALDRDALGIHEADRHLRGGDHRLARRDRPFGLRSHEVDEPDGAHVRLRRSGGMENPDFEVRRHSASGILKCGELEPPAWPLAPPPIEELLLVGDVNAEGTRRMLHREDVGRPEVDVERVDPDLVELDDDRSRSRNVDDLDLGRHLRGMVRALDVDPVLATRQSRDHRASGLVARRLENGVTSRSARERGDPARRRRPALERPGLESGPADPDDDPGDGPAERAALERHDLTGLHRDRDFRAVGRTIHNRGDERRMVRRDRPERRRHFGEIAEQSPGRIGDSDHLAAGLRERPQRPIGRDDHGLRNRRAAFVGHADPGELGSDRRRSRCDGGRLGELCRGPRRDRLARSRHRRNRGRVNRSHAAVVHLPPRGAAEQQHDDRGRRRLRLRRHDQSSDRAERRAVGGEAGGRKERGDSLPGVGVSAPRRDQPLPKLPQRALVVHAHRARRNSGLARDLGEAPALEVPEKQRRPVRLRELEHEACDDALPLRPRHDVGGRGRLPCSDGRDLAPAPGRVALLAANGGVPDDMTQPPAERRPDLGRAVQRRHPRVLDDILGRIAAREQLTREPAHPV